MRTSIPIISALLLAVAGAAPAADVLVNGGFESGAGVGWQEVGGGYELILPGEESPVDPHDGGYLAWLGGADGATHELWQEVVVPAGTARLTLRCWTWISSQEPSGAAHDILTFALRTTSGDPIETLISLSNLDHAAAWTEVAASASAAHAGETIRVQILAQTDGSLTTNFFLAQVALLASTSTPVQGETWGGVKALYR